VSKRNLFLTVAIGLLALLIAFPLVAQQSAPSQDSQQQPPPPPPEQKKAKKEKKAKTPAQQDTLDTSVFNQQVANDVIGQIRDGLEGHSTRLLLGAFTEDMDGYLGFEDQIEAMFKRYEGFHVNVRIINVSVEGSKGIVTADFQMEELLRGNSNISRKQSQLHFELVRTKKGWKVINVNPMSFFS
jgi:hypothetical protein